MPIYAFIHCAALTQKLPMVKPRSFYNQSFLKQHHNLNYTDAESSIHYFNFSILPNCRCGRDLAPKINTIYLLMHAIGAFRY